MKFLNNVKAKGVCNIEMESLGFLAMCNHAGVPGKYRIPFIVLEDKFYTFI